MKKKVVTILLTAAIVCGVLVGCETDSQDKEKAYTEQVKSQSLEAVGLPNISNYFEMSQLKNIYELRDNPDLICYWYTKNQMTGKWVYEGKCIGYGIPYGASITAPEQLAGNYNDSSVIPLSEPNGLYTNRVTSPATWILTVGADGQTKPTYVESEIAVSQEKISAEKCEPWSIPSDY